MLRGVDAGGDLSLFSVSAECARMTESIIKSKAAPDRIRYNICSSYASRELILTVAVQFTDVKEALTPHCDSGVE